MRVPILLFGIAATLAATLAGAAARAADSDEGPLFGPASPRFAADVSTSLRPDGRSRLQIVLQVPYTELQFIQVGGGYGAAAEVLVVARNKKGREVAGDVWEERFLLGSFPETKDPGARLTAARDFAVPPGKYAIKVQVRDLNGGRVAAAERSIEVAGLSEGKLGLADLVFGECVDDPEGEFVRLASRRYGDDLHLFCIESAVYDLARPPATGPYRVSYRILDETGRTEIAGDTSLTAAEARAFRLRPDVSELFLGSYRLELQVEEGQRRSKTSGSFDVEAITVPRGAQWTTLLEILSYVANQDALAPLRDAATQEERSRAWREFWGRRDPTPDTPRNESLIEFMRRIRYANSNFQGFGQGWRTDQGRIYIQYGGPDQIEEVAASHRNPPLQIWHYFQQNRRFIFADRDGFGRYELINVVGG